MGGLRLGRHGSASGEEEVIFLLLTMRTYGVAHYHQDIHIDLAGEYGAEDRDGVLLRIDTTRSWGIFRTLLLHEGDIGSLPCMRGIWLSGGWLADDFAFFFF
jgi:hypothetical protein